MLNYFLFWMLFGLSFFYETQKGKFIAEYTGCIQDIQHIYKN